MLTSRKLDGLEAAAAEIGGETAVFAANAGDIEAADACVAATIERFGGLDILVNNAAANPYAGPTMGIDPARFDKTFQVNIRGPVFWCQSAWRRALRDKPGVIINIASVGGLRAEAILGTYNLTKAALIHLTRQLGNELAPTRVVGIAPGSGEDRLRRLPGRELRRPPRRAACRRSASASREDIANMARVPRQRPASWITGETFVIDGGAGVRTIRSTGSLRTRSFRAWPTPPGSSNTRSAAWMAPPSAAAEKPELSIPASWQPPAPGAMGISLHACSRPRRASTVRSRGRSRRARRPAG